MPDIAYLNGSFMPIDQATVSINDRGFVFADGIYEVIVAYAGHPFRLTQHLRRLERSAAEIRLAIPKSTEQMEELIQAGIKRAGFDDTMIYLQVTRGAAPRQHAFPENVQPTFVATFREKPIIPADKRRSGVNLITIEDRRWGNCFVKSIALLPNTLAYQQAREAGAYEAILHSAAGIVHECSASNVFFVKEGRVITPAKTNKNLHGITRQVVLDFAEDLDIETVEATVSLDSLLEADEVFLSGTTMEVLGVIRIDDHTIGDGKVGPITKRLFQHFSEVTQSSSA
jgi:D-alanine transaminase